MKRKWKKGITVLAVAMTMLCVVAGCKKEENETPEGATPTPGISDQQGEKEPAVIVGEFDTYTEAEMLRTAVTAGRLPEVEYRLPNRANIVVEEGCAPGIYGKDVQFATEHADPLTGALVSEGLFRYAEDGTVAPNIAKSYTVNSDFTKYTIALREGLRWSDGVLFTADDCIFFYEELCLPETFGEPLWDCFTVTNGSKKERAVFQKLDDYSFEVTFPVAKPEFLTELLAQGGICFAPEHYFVNLMPEYMGEDAAKAKAKDMGYAETEEMLRDTVCNAWNTPGVPTLNPYCISTEEGANNVTGEYYKFVRNPYYWKVDAEGKQLPYLDALEFTRVSTDAQKLLLTTEGYLSICALMPEQVAEAELGAERGDYRIVTWSNFLYFAVKNGLGNFPEGYSYEETVRGVGAAHAEGWFFE